jgi:hypothetical protein
MSRQAHYGRIRSVARGTIEKRCSTTPDQASIGRVLDPVKHGLYRSGTRRTQIKAAPGKFEPKKLCSDKPTVCPSNNPASLLLYQSLPTSSEVWRGHGQEAKRGETGVPRIPGHGEAMGSFLLPYAPPGCP